jgi:tetratricopeptide (TPR) repeat protein
MTARNRIGLLILFALPLWAQDPPPGPAASPDAAAPVVIDLSSQVPPEAAGFESLLADYAREDRAGNAAGTEGVFEEMRRLRIERNVESLTVPALGLVMLGHERLGKGDADAARAHFERALALDPHLADAHFGLARAAGIPGGIGHVVSGVLARASAPAARVHLRASLLSLGLLAAFGTAWVLGVGLLIRYGGLLLHDIEEHLGPDRPRVVARGVFVLLLLLPCVAQFGWGYLPLWWTALLIVYMAPVEQGVTLAAWLLLAAVGPLTDGITAGTAARRAPLYAEALDAVSGSGQVHTIEALTAASAAAPEDRQLRQLLGLALRKAGRDAEALALYRALEQEDPRDPVATNNLANLYFGAGNFTAAIDLYARAAEGAPAGRPKATVLYNKALAHFNKLEGEPAKEVRSQADAASPGLPIELENRWRYEKDGTVTSVVVDLAPDVTRLQQRQAGAASAPRLGLLNRFSAALLVFGAAAFGIAQWRGSRIFTLRCVKCGSVFCKLCHLGAKKRSGSSSEAPLPLCTPCLHLFVVKDGVSGPARNAKLKDVDAEEGRRVRTFRLLSLVVPGAGQVFGQSTVTGLLLAAAWTGALVALWLPGRLIEVTLVPAVYWGSWAVLVAAPVAGLAWVLAQLLKPSFQFDVKAARRPVARRG